MTGKTFVFERFDMECLDEYDMLVTSKESSDGAWVKADDAINREAVLTDKIRLLEVQLKEARLEYHRVAALLMRKNKALVEIRDIVQQTFD